MAADAVYKYMKVQNRPYSANDIVANLHNEYGKSAVQKALDQLSAKGKLFEKVYGKQKVYCIIQDSEHDSDELMRIDKDLQAHANEVESKCQDLEKEVKAQEAILESLRSSITLEEAQQEKNQLEQNIRSLRRKLDDLMESIGNEDLTETKKKAEAELREYSREYNKRKRLCTDIIECILESYPGSKNDLYEEIGIEPKIVQC